MASLRVRNQLIDSSAALLEGCVRRIRSTTQRKNLKSNLCQPPCFREIRETELRYAISGSLLVGLGPCSESGYVVDGCLSTARASLPFHRIFVSPYTLAKKSEQWP